MGERIPVTDVPVGASVRVVEVLGGHGMRSRLHSIGIRPGIVVTKVSGFPGHGPVVLQVGGTQTALGFGVCSRIIGEATL
ncbi:MAG TPA: ferrous iron transport protein A [Candidatus Hydrogenedentes bacterium]|nr:ferrous iron transport protein A [Candidatus Hydrogenedentota bacterium]HIJ74112.1 ferrous iron transport protein A [Candidatus Hydrogenedentota bacterium]